MYSSYRHVFHNKKSTTIFIQLEVRWAEKRVESTSRKEFSSASPALVPTRTDTDAALPNGRDFPFLRGAGGEGRPSPTSHFRSWFPGGILGIRNSHSDLQVIHRVGGSSITQRRRVLGVAAHIVGPEDGIRGSPKPTGRNPTPVPR